MESEVTVRNENARLRHQCEVADRGLVHYKEMCIRLKKLCGYDVSRHDISDTEGVVTTEVFRLRTELATAVDVIEGLRTRDAQTDVDQLRELASAAINYINKTPCDPDITAAQDAAWRRYEAARVFVETEALI